MLQYGTHFGSAGVGVLEGILLQLIALPIEIERAEYKVL
jgi:hypothetical protein